jgi:hypothetical protein
MYRDVQYALKLYMGDDPIPTVVRHGVRASPHSRTRLILPRLLFNKITTCTTESPPLMYSPLSNIFSPMLRVSDFEDRQGILCSSGLSYTNGVLEYIDDAIAGWDPPREAYLGAYTVYSTFVRTPT